MSLPIGTPDNIRNVQDVQINPTNGELIALPNYDLPTYGNVIGADASYNKTYNDIGSNGEVVSAVKMKSAESSQSMFSEIKSEIIVGVVVAVVSGIIILAIVRRG